VRDRSPEGLHDRRPGRGLLGRRDFRLLWIGETASGLGNSITLVALPLTAVVVLDAGATAVGVLTAAAWLPWLLVGLPMGAWVDRARKRPLMVACDLLSATALVSVPLAAWLGVLTLAQLVAVALVAGTVAVCFGTTYHAYIPVVLGGRDLLAGNARLQGSEAATQVAGPGTAGLLAQAFGGATGLLADAATFLVSALCLARIRVAEPVPARHEERVPLRRQIVEGLRFVGRDRYLRPLVAYGALANLALMGYQAVQVVFLVRTVGVNPATVGLLLFAAGAFLVGLGITVANVVVGTFRQSYCPPHLLGRVVATAMVVNHSTIPVGSLAGGLLGDAVGSRPAMWIMTGLLAPCWLVLALSPVGRVRDLPLTAGAAGITARA
jgi:MFS family permease